MMSCYASQADLDTAVTTARARLHDENFDVVAHLTDAVNAHEKEIGIVSGPSYYDCSFEEVELPYLWGPERFFSQRGYLEFIADRRASFENLKRQLRMYGCSGNEEWCKEQARIDNWIAR